MNFNELVEKKHALNSEIMNHLIDQVFNIKEAAEYMSECATDMRGQGYSVFLQARENFLQKINEFQVQLGAKYKINTLPAVKADCV